VVIVATRKIHPRVHGKVLDQVDIEMSFVDQEDIIAMGEDMLRKVVKDVKGIDVSGPFPRMTYAEAMDRFGYLPYL
jgi:aspartyl-tRNA synthetase